MRQNWSYWSDFAFGTEKFCLKWQRSENDTTALSSAGWGGVGRGQRKDLLGRAGNWEDGGEVPRAVFPS